MPFGLEGEKSPSPKESPTDNIPTNRKDLQTFFRPEPEGSEEVLTWSEIGPESDRIRHEKTSELSDSPRFVLYSPN